MSVLRFAAVTLALALLVLVTPSAPRSVLAQDRAVPPGFVGTWEGVVTELDPPISFLVVLHLEEASAGGSVGTIVYPWCRGTLAFASVDPAAGSLVVTTDLMTAAVGCQDGQTLQLTLLADGALDYLWSDLVMGDSATGRLRSVPGDLAPRNADPLPLGFVGSWEGTATQINPEAQVPVELELRGGQSGLSVGTVSYPTQSCSGDLILRTVGMDRIELIERISTGAEFCADAGTVSLTLAPDATLDFDWQHPVVESPAAGPLALAPGSPTQPALVRISAIGVAACIVPLRIVGGAMEDPFSPWTVGWYSEIAWPGEAGNVVMVGARDWAQVDEAIFGALDVLRQGDVVELAGTRGEFLRYRVVSLETYDKQSAPIAEIVGPTGTETLTLLSDAEPFDADTGQYLDILVVRAERADEGSAELAASDSPPATPVSVEGCRM